MCSVDITGPTYISQRLNFASRITKDTLADFRNEKEVDFNNISVLVKKPRLYDHSLKYLLHYPRDYRPFFYLTSRPIYVA